MTHEPQPEIKRRGPNLFFVLLAIIVFSVSIAQMNRDRADKSEPAAAASTESVAP